MKKHLIAAAIAATALSTASHADGLHPVLGASVTGGGKTLVKVEYQDGHTQNIRSGGLVHLFGGAEYESGPFAFQANIGYHVDDTHARDGSVRFSRWPIELIGFFKPEGPLRLGLGVRKATGAKIATSGKASYLGSDSFESKAGLILQGEYLFSPHWSGLLRVVREDYKVGGTTVQGNHVGLGGSYRF
ncbi:hypothetical protein J2X20_003498 [Pelomonas saccharophila]|jgi:hypothetical protein|uniref:Outer membrane protein beta-barrel domain-containing protein n=1 Tax=Roseateles saccharophilus TaxID=304 RepID=A0ABU1YPQ4_ROSSA|nr:hypothetical protein [Roseateles saccharophilus]MDR7270840.1 hypothetical protein [Roseateles saccharophilus]